ncbi:haloacid dehalogenase-like hydrolase [Bibersteinia trehalosi]|uniref:haloacid dehalogenase-like hydrolase n=1 Tax=Bibersteinia trehalosi TaxID=47735 RepID=UPI003D2A9033
MKPLFFDIDGTLHKEDMFAAFLRFLIARRLLTTLIFLPLILMGVLIWRCRPTGQLGVRLMYSTACIGLNEATYHQMIQQFAEQFKGSYTPFKQVLAKLNTPHRILLISGSPTEIIQAVYADLVARDNVRLIGTLTKPCCGTRQITQRCYREQKVKMLDKDFPNLHFAEGYSDSLSDVPILMRCERAFLISKQGDISVLHLQNSGEIRSLEQNKSQTLH